MAPLFTFSQEKAKDSVVEKPERPAFESSSLIDNQTNVLFNKNTLEVMMQHRFGPIDGENTLLGIYGPSNIRIGAAYSILDWVTVGYGMESAQIGAVGVLGPTRMDYAGSIAAVDAVARYVGRFLIEGV